MAKPLKVKKISPDDPVDEAVARILMTRIREFYSHWPDPSQAPTSEQLHNMRISGKRLRYSAESLREFFPDRLALLVDLLKRGQDLMGEIQDCVTQKMMIEEDLKRLRRRDPHSKDLPVLEDLISNYDERQSLLTAQFREIWHGMTIKEFRDSLKAMVAKPQIPKADADEAFLQLINPS